MEEKKGRRGEKRIEKCRDDRRGKKNQGEKS